MLVQGVAGASGARLFGSTSTRDTDTLEALGIDNSNGCVEPSAETAQAGEYAPLTRPLFVYVNDTKFDDNTAVKEYVDYYIENLADIAEIGKFIPLSDELYSETQSNLEGIAS